MIRQDVLPVKLRVRRVGVILLPLAASREAASDNARTYRLENNSVEKQRSMRSGNTVTTVADSDRWRAASSAAVKFSPELGPTGKPWRMSRRVISILRRHD